MSRAEYDRMIACGRFDNMRVELLCGEVVEMSPQGPMHSEVIHRLLEHLMPALAGRARIRIQAPLVVFDHSEPEPDLVLVAPADYTDAHPTTAYLVVEVASTSLPTDRGIKSDLYAACQIPEYWIVNLVERVIEIHSRPHGGKYRSRTTRQPTDTLHLHAFPDISIPAADIIP